jgi:hypothetical protein
MYTQLSDAMAPLYVFDCCQQNTGEGYGKTCAVRHPPIEQYSDVPLSRRLSSTFPPLRKENVGTWTFLPSATSV